MRPSLERNAGLRNVWVWGMGISLERVLRGGSVPRVGAGNIGYADKQDESKRNG